jgi:hypothetical protein
MMKFRQLLILTLLLPLMAVAEDTGPDFEAVGMVIDDFHDAAAHGDKERYFGHLTQREGILPGLLRRDSCIVSEQF